MKMENICLARLVFTLFLAMCSADFSNDDLYDIMASKFDNVHFDIRNIRNDIKELSERNEVNGQSGSPEKCEELKEMLEKVKIEADAKLSQIENVKREADVKLSQIEKVKIETDAKLSQHEKVKIETDAKLSQLEKKLVNTNKKIRKKLTRVGFGEKRINVKVEKNLQVLRTAVIDGKLFVHDLVNSFEGRVEHVENKMFAFENASCKGDKGDIGLPGPRGPTGHLGEKGNKGDIGFPGQKGPHGFSGAKGSRGLRGMPGEKGSRGLIGFSGVKGERGLIGAKGLQGNKGQKGSPESRNSVYFAVSLKDNIELQPNTMVRFDDLLRNTGNGYSTTSGKFKAPYSGVYLFIFFVEAYGGIDSYASVRLFVNGRFSAYAIAELRHEYHDVSGGNSFVSYLSAGEEAWLQTSGDIGPHYVDGPGSTFTGVLLY